MLIAENTSSSSRVKRLLAWYVGIYTGGYKTMNKEQAIKKIEELKRFVRECEVKKTYYWTYVYENKIYHSARKDTFIGDVAYEDENIIVEHSDFGGTFVRYKNGKKA